MLTNGHANIWIVVSHTVTGQYVEEITDSLDEARVHEQWLRNNCTQNSKDGLCVLDVEIIQGNPTVYAWMLYNYTRNHRGLNGRTTL